jgi:hypothetical protein
MENSLDKTGVPKFTGRAKYNKLVLMVILVVLSSFTGMVNFSEKPSIEVSNGFLTIKSLFHGKKIPLGEININGIKQLNLNTEGDYGLEFKTNGMKIPFYHVGWMKSNNGNKVLAYLTDKTNVVLIPTKEYDVLISTDNFTEITEALNETGN